MTLSRGLDDDGLVQLEQWLYNQPYHYASCGGTHGVDVYLEEIYPRDINVDLETILKTLLIEVKEGRRLRRESADASSTQDQT